MRTAALIRSKFKIDPYKVSEEEFARLAADALWLTEYEYERMETAVIKAIGFIFSAMNNR